ncbi:hypothetical protein FACS1894110_18370 [Spirochaetia bacterium]|nr:hypothetical protein FACS1894110_18370 [Spirochaetia bacterium]
MVLFIVHIALFLINLFAVVFMATPTPQLEKSVKGWILFGIFEACVVFFAASIGLDVATLWG